MEALNGWNTTENSLQEVRWRIDLFAGIHHYDDADWEKWYEQAINKITYHDKLCGFDRTEEIAPYGFKQGYFNRNRVIDELQEKGIVKIPFAWVYDARQYNKHFDGCFMEISKID